MLEKMMKGVLLASNIPFARTHELNVLAHGVQLAQPAWVWDPLDVAALQPGAVLLRYPDYDAAIQDALAAVAACTRLRNSLLPYF